MPNEQSGGGTVVISAGFPEDRPWVIENTDENVINKAVASLADLASNQSVEMQKQVGVLREQVEAVDAIKDKIAALPTGYLVPIAQDAAGVATLTDVMAISDLVGRDIKGLSMAEIDRLIAFTDALLKNSMPVDLTIGDVYKVTEPSSPPNPGSTEPPPSPVSGTFEAVYLREGNDGFSLAGLERERLYRNVDDNPIKSGTFKLSAWSDNPPYTRDISYSAAGVVVQTEVAANAIYDGVRLDIRDASGKWVTVGGQLNTHYGRPFPVDGPFPSGPGYYFSKSEKTGELSVYRLNGTTPEIVSPLNVRNVVGFVLPESNNELVNLIGRASATRLTAKLEEISGDGIQFELTDKTTVEWTNTLTSSKGYANLPPVAATSWAAMEVDVKIKAGDLVKLVETKPGETQPTTTYYVKGGTYKNADGSVTKNWFIEVTVDETKAFQLIPTEQDVINLRGAYGEKALQLGQRSTEQQLFLNQMINKYNALHDAATFVLKALSDLARRLSNIS